MPHSPLLLGNLSISPPVVQAPLAGVSDQAFRRLNRRFGCPLVFAEMVSDKALTYGSRETRRMLAISDAERPVAVQLFGSEPEFMRAAAALVLEISRPQVLDINMGCPALKVVRNGEGSALMRRPDVAAAVVRAVVGVASQAGVPVTVKMRLGWTPEEITYLELIDRLQDEGVAGFTVHGRTRDQFYSGSADWHAIGLAKAHSRVPVVGNGDVKGPDEAVQMLSETGCDAVMVGRAALGNPWVFQRIVAFLERGERLPEPSIGERLDVALEHADMLIQDKGEHIAMREMRKHLAWYMRGSRGAARLREAVNSLVTMADMESLVDRCRHAAVEEPL